MRIIIAGTGYVGLVTGACLAGTGHHVTCVDIDASKIARLHAGDIPIYEPGLETLVRSGVMAGNLVFRAALPVIDQSVDAVFIAVGTPTGADGTANLGAVFAIADQIAAAAVRNVTVVVKSTVPPGTGDLVEASIRRSRPDLAVTVASNPEFLREGSAISDFMEPDRIVIGTDDPAARLMLTRLYAPITSFGIPFLAMGRTAAELSKYAANAFLATKIAFVNEMADLCEAIGADVDEVASGMGSDSRIGSAFLSAGPGYGGSCFPKDVAALRSVARAASVRLRVVEGAAQANINRKHGLWRRVEHALGGSLAGRAVAVLGLAFKACTDDIRESPALDLVHDLVAAGANVVACDPKAADNARAAMPGLLTAPDAYRCVRDCDCVVLLTDWPEFRTLDLHRLSAAMARPVFVDLRNAMDVDRLRSAGFDVHRVGQATDPARQTHATESPDTRRAVACPVSESLGIPAE